MTGIAAEGTWDLALHTPVGKRQVILVLSSDEGLLQGIARDLESGEEVLLRDIVFEEDRLTWVQSITKPMWLELAFDVTISGDELTGRSKAGFIPSSKPRLLLEGCLPGSMRRESCCRTR